MLWNEPNVELKCQCALIRKLNNGLSQPYELWPHFFMSLQTCAKHFWGVFKANDIALTMDISIYEATDTCLLPILVRLVHIAELWIEIQRKPTKYKKKIFAVYLQQGASSTVCLVIAIQQANQDYHATIKIPCTTTVP